MHQVALHWLLFVKCFPQLMWNGSSNQPLPLLLGMQGGATDLHGFEADQTILLELWRSLKNFFFFKFVKAISTFT